MPLRLLPLSVVHRSRPLPSTYLCQQAVRAARSTTWADFLVQVIENKSEHATRNPSSRSNSLGEGNRISGGLAMAEVHGGPQPRHPTSPSLAASNHIPPCPIAMGPARHRKPAVGLMRWPSTVSLPPVVPILQRTVAQEGRCILPRKPRISLTAALRGAFRYKIRLPPLYSSSCVAFLG